MKRDSRVNENQHIHKHVLAHCLHTAHETKLTCGIEEPKDLSIGLCGDGSLSLQIVRLYTIASGYPVLADNHAPQSLLIGQVKHSLRLALNQQLAQRVTLNEIGRLNSILPLHRTCDTHLQQSSQPWSVLFGEYFNNKWTDKRVI